MPTKRSPKFTYQVVVKGPLPPNLGDVIATAHAAAILHGADPVPSRALGAPECETNEHQARFVG